ncbi:MAG: DNA polymerase I [Bacteroidota bacterium]
MTKRERLFLLDGMALAYRAYFTFINRPLLNSKGENTSAIYGFVNTLMKILDEDKPEHIAVVFDTPEPTFRHKKFAAYKATREKMPEAMANQLDRLKEVVEAFNVPILEAPGYEADDVIGTLAKRAEAKGIETNLVTGDKDFMQLISPLIKMYKPGKRGDDWEIIDEKGVEAKFGVAPERVTDVLGLTGDKSDNVPGVPGIGEKTAVPLVREYGSIENILKSIERIPQKGLQEKLRQNKESALLSKELVTIDTNVPIKVDIHHLEAKPRDTKKLRKIFTELEFGSLLKKLLERTPQTDEDISFDVTDFKPLTDITTDEHEYRIVKSAKELEELCRQLASSRLISFDTETTSLNPLEAELIGLSFATKPGEAYYVPVAEGLSDPSSENTSVPPDQVEELGLFGQRPEGVGPADQKVHRRKTSEHEEVDSAPVGQCLLDLPEVLHQLKPVLENPGIKKCGQNVKFDLLGLSQHGIAVRGISFDTMIASYVLRADGQHNLDYLAQEYLNYKMVSYGELVGTGKEKVDIKNIPLERIADYSAQDADITLRLHDVLRSKLEHSRMLKLCEEVEFPLLVVLADMESTGVALDTKFLNMMSKELELLLDNIVLDIHKMAGEKFNINSTQQLSDILFNRLKLPIVRKTKTGYSTDVGVLEIIRNEHPIIERLLEYRQLSKLKSTYVDALPKAINPRTGRVHTSFNQTGTTTGRLSSSDPNLQNIPMHTELGREIRKAFVPGTKDMLILSADYSQIELRVMAHISQDEGLIEAFRNGEDIHATTASKVFGVKPGEVTREMRRRAKEVNFGIMYGIGPFGLSSRLDVSQAEAKDIIARYFERFPKVNQYIFDTIALARHDGYVSTVLGRRRYLPEINSRNQTVRQNAERQAINMPIQGTAADMIKLAMIQIHGAIQRKGLTSKMILQVHDELVFEVEKEELDGMKKLVVEKMQTALPLDVPVEVEVGTGKNWYDAH